MDSIVHGVAKGQTLLSDFQFHFKKNLFYIKWHVSVNPKLLIWNKLGV